MDRLFRLLNWVVFDEKRSQALSEYCLERANSTPRLLLSLMGTMIHCYLPSYSIFFTAGNNKVVKELLKTNNIINCYQ